MRGKLAAVVGQKGKKKEKLAGRGNITEYKKWCTDAQGLFRRVANWQPKQFFLIPLANRVCMLNCLTLNEPDSNVAMA